MNDERNTHQEYSSDRTGDSLDGILGDTSSSDVDGSTTDKSRDLSQDSIISDDTAPDFFGHGTSRDEGDTDNLPGRDDDTVVSDSKQTVDWRRSIEQGRAQIAQEDEQSHPAQSFPGDGTLQGDLRASVPSAVLAAIIALVLAVIFFFFFTTMSITEIVVSSIGPVLIAFIASMVIQMFIRKSIRSSREV